jgi:hypothetical protein
MPSSPISSGSSSVTPFEAMTAVVGAESRRERPSKVYRGGKPLPQQRYRI